MFVKKIVHNPNLKELVYFLIVSSGYFIKRANSDGKRFCVISSLSKVLLSTSKIEKLKKQRAVI